MKKRSCLSLVLITISLLALLFLALGTAVPVAAGSSFGAPDPALNPWQRFNYGLVLLSRGSALAVPLDPDGTEQLFVIEAGEDALTTSSRLVAQGLIADARTFRIYLAWTGMDSYIQTGTFRLSPALSAEEIAAILTSASLTEVKFTVLAGWRMEEVAAALPTSGLDISPDAFLTAAASPVDLPAFLPLGASAEGFLFPDAYTLPRSTHADQLVSLLLQTFASRLPPEYTVAYSTRGLTVYQAVILASIIEREAVDHNEMPLIASVFFNRLAVDMPLQTDPTVQYALGFNALQSSWWTTPLSTADLQVTSPYNTYLFRGLPPGPIANPSLDALAAVAYPAESPYYYFQARCDGSGTHNFTETYEQHQQNNCPR